MHVSLAPKHSLLGSSSGAPPTRFARLQASGRAGEQANIAIGLLSSGPALSAARLIILRALQASGQTKALELRHSKNKTYARRLAGCLTHSRTCTHTD